MGNSSHTELALRIVNILPNSPALRAKLEPMLDFVIYRSLDEGFSSFIARHEGKEMKLTVYNIVTQETREVTVNPSRTWGGNSLLGATIRAENYTDAHNRILFVEDVFADSPSK